MSLDLYIISKEPVIKRGTGVFIRENGQTRELKTVAEVKAYFPDADTSEIVDREYELTRSGMRISRTIWEKWLHTSQSANIAYTNIFGNLMKLDFRLLRATTL